MKPLAFTTRIEMTVFAGTETVEQQIVRQAGRKLFVRRFVPGAPQKTTKQRQQRIARTPRRRRVNFTHQGFKSRPIQNRFGFVQTCKEG